MSLPSVRVAEDGTLTGHVLDLNDLIRLEGAEVVVVRTRSAQDSARELLRDHNDRHRHPTADKLASELLLWARLPIFRLHDGRLAGHSFDLMRLKADVGRDEITVLPAFIRADIAELRRAEDGRERERLARLIAHELERWFL